jgi:fatty acid-binding protein DegV
MGNMQRALSQYVSDLATEYTSYDKRRAFVTHSPTDGRELIEEVKAKVKELFEFEEILETQAGATVSTHCGKNTIGVLFIAE